MSVPDPTEVVRNGYDLLDATYRSWVRATAALFARRS